MWGACAGADHKRNLKGDKKRKIKKNIYINAWVWKSLQKINNNLEMELGVQSRSSAPPSAPCSLYRMKNLHKHLSLAPPPTPPTCPQSFLFILLPAATRRPGFPHLGACVLSVAKQGSSTNRSKTCSNGGKWVTSYLGPSRLLRRAGHQTDD